MKYDAWFSESASETMLSLPDHAFLEVGDVVLLLTDHPELGRSYDPLYPAARSDLPLRVIYAGTYGIYYTPDHQHYLIRVHFIEDQHMNPATRFTGRLR